MTPDQVFKICNSIAPIGWLLMIVAPKWRFTKMIILSGILPLMLGLVYLIILFFGEGEGDFNSLQGVMKLFTNPWGVTAGWIHYLAFDLFIGTWELSNGQKNGIPHYLIIPCLILTLFFGPIGLILYFLIRANKTKKFIHENF
jgi:hypothetical protein